MKDFYFISRLLNVWSGKSIPQCCDRPMFQFIETSCETQTSDSWSAANISVRLVHSTVKTRTALKWISSDVCKRWLHEVCVSQPTSQDSFVCDVCIAQYS
ncbi:hypothetical protein DPMN_092263 [Dreissena polymorpha]|uniref:Uncharacterized protein n=1 Tax=Dreissena polymorpha TaxID=45954 RepID=A0A9D4L221_DREPO|nr:hypothetical protein DPMN_092263 [Dreissena polymorpha]